MSFENEQYVSSRMDRVEALEQEITRLKQQLEEAVEVIEFYADTENWDSKEGINDTCIDGVVSGSDIYSPWGEVGISVGGKKARQFLAKYRGGK